MSSDQPMTAGMTTEGNHAQSVVHFFLPLPEPVGVPNGYYVQCAENPGVYEGLRWRTGVQLGEMVHEFLPEGPILRFWQHAVTYDPFSSTYPIAAQRWGLASAAPNVLPPGRQTVVEVVEMLPQEAGEEGLEVVLDQGLAMLRAWQRARYLVAPSPATLVTRERLPAALLMGLGWLSEAAYEAPSELGCWIAETGATGALSPSDEAGPTLASIEQELPYIESRPFSNFLEFRRESQVALYRDGDYRSALLFSATACETLLDELLGHLLWDERMSPESAADVYLPAASTTLHRVRSQYAQRLRGQWNPDQPGPVQEWREAVASKRNRVIHSGWAPERGDAEEALRVTAQLLSHVASRLTSKDVLARYERTALALLGKDGLSRRNKWSERLEAVSTLASEEDSRGTFSRWYAAVGLVRSEASGANTVVKPDVSRSYCYLVLKPDGTEVWCLHDRLARRARIVEADRSLLSPEQVETLPDVISAMRGDGLLRPISMLLDINVALTTPVGSWDPEYFHIPEAGVMRQA